MEVFSDLKVGAKLVVPATMKSIGAIIWFAWCSNGCSLHCIALSYWGTCKEKLVSVVAGGEYSILIIFPLILVQFFFSNCSLRP